MSPQAADGGDGGYCGDGGDGGEGGDGDNVSCTGSESEGRSGSSDEEMNENLNVCHDSLGYEKRFELRQCKRMGKGI